MISSRVYAAVSSRLVNMISESGVGQRAFPRLSFSIWGLVYCDLRLFMRRAVTDWILKKGNASDGRKRYNSVLGVTKVLCERKLGKKAMNSVWQSTGMYMSTIFFFLVVSYP